MHVTLDKLKNGINLLNTIGAQREQMKAGGMTLTSFLVTYQDSENYLSFAAALDSMRRYAGASWSRAATWTTGSSPS